jgi:cytochrome c553
LCWNTTAAADFVAEDLDSIQQRVHPCAACHGKEGRATREGYFPRIAGKPAGYLFNQLVLFRDGKRNFPMMSYLVERQTDAYLREIAEHFASLDVPYAAPHAPTANSTTLERGKTLVLEGDDSQKIPACQSCHGKRLLGVAPAVPGLLGLSGDYLTAQLGAWQNRSRQAQSPDCMAQISRRLRAQDIAAVAAWLAAQPVPEDPLPDTAFVRAPALRCGSIIESGVSP